MIIRIVNKNNRSLLVCIRDNGTTEISNIGPALSFHDIAHYVVEKTMGIRKGFYGNINDGYSVSQLSDKTIIQTLTVESTTSEIITRALQSLAGGAFTISQVTELVRQEFQVLHIDYPLTLNEEKIASMLSEYTILINQWKNLKEGEALAIEFDLK